MERKPKLDSYVQPMPKSQFLKLMREFKSIGGKYICNEESEAFLSVQGAEAIALDGYTILFRRKPTRSAVYEELFHTEQFRSGKIDGTPKNRCECEIEAQKYLLDNAKGLQLTEPEIEQTKRALEWYTQKLSEAKEGEP
ncbi:MAG: hypothetical protein IJU50_07300 [Lachnospiraceae bacterium]|nr:hypothetical protein [Lachnospiraceae bacterium]